ncbi:MAG: MBOAT family O-acyltransferase [Mangrovibacterium sp.]
MGIFVNLLVLVYYKYTTFIADTISQFTGKSYEVIDLVGSFFQRAFYGNVEPIGIMLPIGISFYTFQAIGYLVDVRRKNVVVVRNPFDFAFFISFFPQLVAGPIIKAAAFIPQLYQKYKLKEDEFSHALYLILKGLFKKMVIADYLATNLIDGVFNAPWAYSGLENLISIYSYAIQIYFDFSGYTDIAIGLALILGFKIPINFNSPYQATSITDFWHRWHISLSKWLRDYLYIPLGGNRKGSIRTYMNSFITMLLGGLWHGANWKFVIWGAIHGAALSIEKFFHTISTKKRPHSRLRKFVSQIVTFHVVCLSWVFFRANDMESIRQIFHQISYNFIPAFSSSEWLFHLPKGIFIVLGFLLISISISFKEKIRGRFIGLHWIVKSAICILIVIAIHQVSSLDSQPFIYFRF